MPHTNPLADGRGFSVASLLGRQCATQRSDTESFLRRVRQGVDSIGDLSRSALASHLERLRQMIVQPTPSKRVADEHLGAVFAVATLATQRQSGKRFYDVQLQAGRVMANGELAEMATGEGKTLTTILPIVSAFAHGQRVHVATTNAYLAQRDCEIVAPVLQSLGISVASLPEGSDDDAKRRAYASDVTYGTGYEFGFDFLRDQIRLRNRPNQRCGANWLRQLRQRGVKEQPLVMPALQCTIIDEIDSVLIDEANTPLVISTVEQETVSTHPYRIASETARAMQLRRHFMLDPISGRIQFTRAGMKMARDAKRRIDTPLQRSWVVYVENALRAQHVLKRDVDYVIVDDTVAIVDPNTGRIFEERRWRDGLHQAIQWENQVTVTPHAPSNAKISRQRFFQMYPSATGMSGTAMDAADEFHECFGLTVRVIPRNRPSLRQDLPYRYFADSQRKREAIVADTRRLISGGRPVLIGTVSIADSRYIADGLSGTGIDHQLLCGEQDEDEAKIVAGAGQAGMVTVATNMAGRGTDISLSADACSNGGLHVIVASPNRSRRVDRQLIGRAARQGDPGSSQTYIAADDAIFHPDGDHVVAAGKRLAAEMMQRENTREDRRMDRMFQQLQAQTELRDREKQRSMMRHQQWQQHLLEQLIDEDPANETASGQEKDTEEKCSWFPTFGRIAGNAQRCLLLLAFLTFSATQLCGADNRPKEHHDQQHVDAITPTTFRTPALIATDSKNGVILGFTEPIKKVELAAATAGILKSVQVEPGQHVQAGDVIARLDDSVLLAAKRLGEKKLLQTAKRRAAEIRLERAQQHVDTLRQLQSEGNGASREVQLAESDLQLAENDLRAVEEQRALDQLDLKRIDAEMMGRRIVANTSGVVIDVLRQPGEFVSLSDPVVITLVQLKQLRIQFYAPIEIADSLRKGQTTTLQFLHDRQTARANVTYVSPVIDANSNTVRVDVILNNTDGRYQSGRRCILLAKPTGNATTRSTRSSMQGFLR